MTVPARPSKHNHCNNVNKLKQKRKIIHRIVWMMLLLLFVIIFMAQFSLLRSNDSNSNTYNTRGGAGAIPKKKVAHQSSSLPVWTTRATDGIGNLSTYGTIPLTGSHVYKDGVSCQESHRNGNPSNVCLIHFPFLDLKIELKHDEANDVGNQWSLQKRGGRFRQQQTNQQQSQPNTPPLDDIIFNMQLDPSIDQEHALLTRGGFKEQASGVKVNQDRAILVSPFHHKNGNTNGNKIDGDSTSATQANNFLMGILDGHGSKGHAVSNFAAIELPRVLSQQLEQIDGSDESAVKQAITNAVKEIDESLPYAIGAGSTACMLLRLGSRIYAANVGDSTSFLATHNTRTRETKIVYTNALHKPHMPKEKARIYEMGGVVVLPQSPLDSSRVLIYTTGDESPGAPAMALAMSRSIGDLEGRKQGVLSTPTVDALNLDTLIPMAQRGDLQLFAVSASDGVFDRIKPLTVAESLSASLYHAELHESNTGNGSSKRIPRLLEMCESIIMKSSRLWIQGTWQAYRDDISIAVTKVIL